MGMDTKDDDVIDHLFVASTHDYLLFFTTVGKVYRVKVHELPLGTRQSKGRALVNVLPLRQDERVRAVIDTRTYSEGRYLLFATRKGLVKKTEFKAYDTVLKADGIIALKIREGDELVGVRLTDGDDHVLLVSRNGSAVRFSEHDVRSMGRDTTGVAGMKLRAGDEVISVEIARDDQDLLVVTENGFGKRTRIAEYPAKGRGTMGVLTIRYTESRGRLAGAMIVRDGYEVMLISQDGTVIRQKAEGISRMGRATQGVRVMNLREGDRLSSIARVTEPQTDMPDGEEVIDIDPAEADAIDAGADDPADTQDDEQTGEQADSEE
jgi:DNA gyrase subunit A